MKNEILVGKTNNGNGVNAQARGSKEGATVVSKVNSEFTEAARQGDVFIATNPGVGVTLAATHAIGAAVPVAGAATPILAIANPVTNNTQLLAINKIKVQTVSGTPGGGFLVGFIPQEAQFTGVKTNKPINTLSLAASGNAYAIANIAVVGTTQPVQELRVIGGPAAIASGAGMYHVEDFVAGAVLVPAGSIVGIFAQAAGTTHVVKASIEFEVINI
jgi:hypothetical protein